MSELDVLIEGELIGRVRMNKASRLSFEYEPCWRDSPGCYSLSVSMPLTSIIYSHNSMSPYLSLIDYATWPTRCPRPSPLPAIKR